MGNKLMGYWEKARNKPGGPWLVSKILGFVIPYTGSINPRVLELRPGYARVTMNDRRRYRNHLNSIHALAQMNLAEFSTGLAMTAQLSPKTRAIITGLSIEYTKKARGRLVAECSCGEIDQTVSGTHQIVSVLRDASGDVVSRATAHWLVGPKGAG